LIVLADILVLEERLCFGPIFLLGEASIHTLDDVLHRKCRLKARVYRVVIALEKFTQGVDGFWIDREATEEVDDILVAHA